MLENLNLVDKRSVWDQIEDIDWRVKTVMIIVSTMLLGFIIMMTLANVMNVSSTPKEIVKEILPLKPGAPEIPPPTEVVSLRVYPIKSCRGFEVTSTRLRKMGLTLDRNWYAISRLWKNAGRSANFALFETKDVRQSGRQKVPNYKKRLTNDSNRYSPY